MAEGARSASSASSDNVPIRRSGGIHPSTVATSGKRSVNRPPKADRLNFSPLPGEGWGSATGRKTNASEFGVIRGDWIRIKRMKAAPLGGPPSFLYRELPQQAAV